jgi:hypothetical protein
MCGKAAQKMLVKLTLNCPEVAAVSQHKFEAFYGSK